MGNIPKNATRLRQPGVKSRNVHYYDNGMRARTSTQSIMGRSTDPADQKSRRWNARNWKEFSYTFRWFSIEIS